MKPLKLNALDAAIEAEIRNRPQNMQFPRCGTRFRALRFVTVDGATYLQISGTDAVVPIDVWRNTIERDDVLLLNYEPPIDSSTHCSLLPNRYEHYEAAVVDLRFRDDPGYLGYAFSISYKQLDEDFEWLPPDELSDDRPVTRSPMASWLQAQMANNRLNVSGGPRLT